MRKKSPKLIERKLGRERADGQYIEDDGLIEIDPRLRARNRLEIVIHEALHHARPDLSERDVAALARAAADVLWRDNWRRVEV